MIKIFVSSTYLDLKDYRSAVIEQLNRMKVDGVKMEYFGASEAEPTAFSLDELESCNVYVGIIGHRYGQLSPDGERSITRCEYQRAKELREQGKMQLLLLYLADDHEVQIPKSLIERDELRKRQEAFRSSLATLHTPRSFRSPTELASWVSADLYTFRERGGLREDKTIKLFGRDDWPVIQDEFDSIANDRFSRIHRFLHFLAERFAELFHIDPNSFDIHPFFKEVRNQLKSLIPGISLDDQGGILKRTGVRHVILRTETALLLVKSLTDEKKLREIGEQIGTGAASDLMKNTVEARQLIPASAEAFVTLWNYWDRTGGWGNLHLLEASDSQGPLSTSAYPEWRIKIENNFLATQSLDETHRLCNFWCGYVKGVLNETLPRINDLMTKTLDAQQKLKVALPAYYRVHEVIHESDTHLTQDTFRIRFEKERFSEARQRLSDCQSSLIRGELSTAMALARAALECVKNEPGIDFPAVLKGMNFEDGRIIQEMLDKGFGFPDQPDEKTSTNWFKATNLLIQQLSQQRTKRE